LNRRAQNATFPGPDVTRRNHRLRDTTKHVLADWTVSEAPYHQHPGLLTLRHFEEPYLRRARPVRDHADLGSMAGIIAENDGEIHPQKTQYPAETT